MKIVEGLKLDPRTFQAQVRGLRHLRPLVEKKDERSVIEALHAAWLQHLDIAIEYYSLAIGYLRDVEEYPGEWKPIEKFTRNMDKLEKKLRSFEKQTYKWRTGVNLYFERPVDVGRLKGDLQTNLKFLENMKKELATALKDAIKLKGGKVNSFDVDKAQASMEAMSKAMNTAIAGL